MNKDDSFYIKELQPIREFCLHSDKEDVYKYIYSLQQENKELQQKVNQLEEKEELHLNRIDELTDRVVKSQEKVS